MFSLVGPASLDALQRRFQQRNEGRIKWIGNNRDGVGPECRHIRFSSGSAMTAGNKRHKPAVGPRRTQKRSKGRENTESAGTYTQGEPLRRDKNNGRKCKRRQNLQNKTGTK